MTIQPKILSRTLPFAVYILFLALGDYLSPLLASLGVDVRWLYIIRVTVVLSLLIYFWRDYSELIYKPKILDMMYAAIAGLLVLVFWILPFPGWASLGTDLSGFNPIQGQSSTTAFLWLSTRILGATLVVPVMEELFWRSFVMRWIDKKNFLTISPENVSRYAFVASAVLFALEHHLWLAGLVAGLVYGALYIKSKNLWIPILAHAITNGLLGIWVVQTGNWQYW